MKKFLFFVVIFLFSVVTSWAQTPQGSSDQLSNPNPVSSSCLPVTQFPWFEGFESPTTWPAADAPGNAIAPPCWLNFNGGSTTTTYLWRRTSGTAAYIRTGTGAAQHYTSATAVTNDYLITPIITLTGNERLRFYVKGYSTYVDHFRVAIYDINQAGQDISSMNDTTLFATIIPHSFVPSTDWSEYIINLNNYVGNFRIAFIRDLVGGYYLNLDDVTIETIPTCPQPVSSSFVVDTTSVTINWIPANQSQTSFYLYYKESTATNYDSVIVNATTYTIQNLVSGSTYNYYIKADCGIEFSATTPVKTFKTLCSVITALPVSDSFDTYGTGTSAYPTCWMRLGTNAGNPYISTTNASSPGSLYFNVAYAYGYSVAIAPKIDASIPINTIKATLKFRASGPDDTLYVGVMSDPYQISTFEQVGFITANATGVFEDKEFFFSNYTGTGQFIAIKAAYSATSSTVYVDNVALSIIPSCSNPTALTASNITYDQINLGWLENGTATTWNIEYGPTGFTHGSGTLLSGVTSDPYLITGLSPQTTYQFYVQADCGGTLSPWSNQLTVTTACTPLTTIPYSESFDTYGTGTGTFPTCWTKFGSSTTYPYINTTNFSAPGSLYLYNSASGNYNYAILPAFDATIPVNTLQMSFKFRASGTDDTLYVGVMSDPSNLTTFTVISTYTVPVTATFYDINTYFGSYTGTGANIAFKSTYGASSSTIYVDNVVVSAMPTCPTPSNLAATNVLATDLNLQWTENGSATSWNIEYGPTGFTPGTGIILTGVSTNPLTINNLTAQTQYQFYIQSDCGGGTLSPWTSPLSITTACSEIITLPWTDFFDTYGTGSTVFPPCWTRNTTYADRPYVNATAYAGAGSLYFYAGTAGTYNIAATPIFSSQIPMNTLMASFKYRTTNATDSLYVGVMTDPMVASSFETVAVLRNNSTSTWEDEMVFFTNYTGTGRYIAFKIYHAGSAVYAYIDNLTVETAPTCILPTQLTVSNVTSGSLDLNWIELGTSTSWNIEYGPVGFIQGTGTLLSNITTNPYTISGLNPQTAYQFYVQSICGTETSAWSAPLSAMTGCGIITQLPYNESFDLYGTGTSTFPTCWTKVGNLTTYPSISTTNNSAPGSLYLYCSSSGYYNYAITPQFDATIPVNTLRMEFKMRATGLDDTLYVGVMSSPTDTTTFELITQLTVPVTAVFDDYGINFNSYTGTGQYLAFKTKYGLSSAGIYIDNLHVMPIPNCPRPIDLGVTNVTDISAELFWSEDGTATSWKVEYGPTGFIPGTGTMINGLTDTTVLITGLTAQTTYQFYAYADCGGGNISLASNVFSFTTACAPLLAIPYTENFDTYGTGSSTFPTCWRKLSSYVATSYPYLSTTNFSTPASMYFYSGTAGSYNIVIAPTFDGTIPLTTLKASFKFRASALDDTLYVGVISNINDPSSFVTLQKINATVTATWQDAEVFFSNYTGSGLNIAFKNAYSTNSSTIYVDNVVIDLIPSCPKPSSLSATAIQTNSLTLGFTENGTATTWNIEYGPVGFLPGTGTGTLISGINTNPYNITGLTAQTTYQFYVQAVCSASDFSLWSIPITITTACAEISTLPLTENFDTYGTGTGTFPTCWNKLSSSTTYPYISSTNFTSPGSLYLYASTSGGYCYAITPQFDNILPINNLMIEFKLRNSAVDDTLYVGVMSDPADQNSFELVSKFIPSTTATWQDFELYLNNYTGTGRYIAFKSVYTTTTTTLYVDNLKISTIPTCPKPTQLIVSNPTPNGVTLNWTENGTATNWTIEYGPTGFVSGTGTLITGVTTNPYIISGLQPQTAYDFYVKSNCGVGDESLWSNGITYTTPCASITTIPWTDFFDTYGTGTTIFPTCWTRNTTYANRPYVNAVNYQGVGSLYFYAGTAGTYNIAATPMFDPTIPINSLTATFKYRTYYLTDTMYVGVMTDPTDASTFVLVHKFGAPTTGTFYDREVQFTNYTGTGHYIAFKIQHQGSATSYAYMDNLTIDYIPTCPKPINLIASNTTQNGVNLTWTEVGTATTWKVEFGPSGFTPGTGTSIITTTNPLVLNALTASTCYDFYVQSMCSATDSSIWSVKGLFCTNQIPAVVPVIIDFETPSGLTLVNNPAGNNWYIGTDSAHTVNNTVGGQNALYISNDNGLTNAYTIANSAAVVWAFRDIYFTPSTTDYTITFDWKLYGETDDWDYMNVYSGPLNTPTPLYLSYNIIPPVGSDTLASYINLQSTFQTKTITLPVAQYSGQTKRIFFCWRNDSADGTQPPAAVDNISVTTTGIVNCDVPTNVTVTNVTNNSATVSWTPGGTETAWQVEYKLITSPNWTVPASVSTPTYNIQGLQNNSTYEVRVKALCNPGESPYTTPIQFTTSGGTTTYTINATAAGPGTITPSGIVTVLSGANQLFTFTPNANCEVSTLSINGVNFPNPSLSYTFSNVTSNQTIHVEYGYVGIETNPLSQLVELYPNPTQATIEIRMDETKLKVKECKVFDIYGKLLKIVPISNDLTRIDVSDFANGVYLIRIDSEMGTITKKFVKK